MNYKDMVSLLPYQIAGCPDFVAEKAIKDAVLSYCQRSGAYRLALDPVPTVEGLFEYDIDLPKNTTIVDIQSVTHDSKVLVADTEQGATTANPIWRLQKGTPTHYIRPTNKTLYLVPVPALSSNSISIHASLKPSLLATSISTDFVEDHVDGIMAGAMANLFYSHDMPWANPQRAAKHESDFIALIATAKSRADGRFGATRRTVQYGGL